MKRKGIYSQRIFTQLMVFSLLISLIPTLVIAIYLFQRLESMVANELTNSYNQVTSQYMKNLQEKLIQYQNSLDVIADNTIILETLVNQTESPYTKGKRISEEITKSLLLDRQQEIQNCMLYSAIDNYPAYGKSSSTLKEAQHEKWFSPEHIKKDDVVNYFSPAGNTPILSFIKNIEAVNIHNYSKQQLGVLKLDLLMTRVFEPAETSVKETSAYDVIVYENNGQIFYSSDPVKNNLAKPWLKSDHFAYDDQADGFIINQASLKGYDLTILFLFNNQQLLVKQQEVRRMVIPMVLAVSFLIVLGTSFYSRQFSLRIKQLVKKFKKMETGDLGIDNPIEGNDEVAELDTQFSKMLTKLDALIKKNYIRELENKEAQLKNLQFQINPHFLYNTLEIISSLAAVRQVFSICEICQKLGSIFRYNLGKKSSNFATLTQELEHAQNYIFIIQKRYHNRFAIFYNISVNTDTFLTLRFILQPIIENAFLHGLAKQTTAGTLELSIWEEAECLMIQIADDGIGMEPEKVAEITHSINTSGTLNETGNSIGIRNVNQRIKLTYGNAFGISIKSTRHSGSQFDIRLPLIRKGTSAHEKDSINC